MTEADRKTHDDTLALFKGLLDAGSIEPQEYYKQIVIMSHFRLKSGDVRVALDMLKMCPGSYFKEPQEAQMRADPAYKQLVIALTKSLCDLGLAELRPEPEFDLRPTQASAEA